MKKFLFTIGFLIWVSFSMAQNIQISGKVTDESGISLPGVAVMEKGTTNGSVTNQDGIYRIATGPNSTLIFSFMGYKTTEVAVKSQNQIDIVLEESVRAIDEVVVTALGISQEKKSLGYATQEVDAEVITSVNAPNMGNMLSGQVAGLTVNTKTGMFQNPEFELRGKSPLIVVDEIPVETDFFDISATDIENIVVLKGPTASSLYGSRGRNGAILITTKNAKNEGLEITVSNNTMVSAGYTVFPETQTEYGNGSNGKYEFWDGQDGGISDGDMIWGPKFSDNLEIAQWNSPIYDNVTGETIPWWGDVSGTQYDDKSRYSRVPIPWEYHNNLKDFMRTGIISTTNFSIASKSKKASTRLSGFYQSERGRVPNSNLKTGGLTFNAAYNLSEDLTLDAKLSYNKVYSPNYPCYGYGPKNHMYTILIWMGDDVDGQELREHFYVPGQEGYRQANYNYAWYNNVYFAAYELNQKHDRNTVNGQIKLKWDITDEFSIQGRSSAVLKHLFEDRESPKSYLNYGDPREGDYKTWNTDWLNVDNDMLLSYNNDFSENFGLSANAGASMFYRKYQQEYNATDGLVVPWVYSLNNSLGNVKASTNYQEREIRSVFGTVTMDLINSFFLTLTARNDWSSTLPESNNSYFYPSVSLSTLVSNLIELPETFDYLKLYGSWAEVSSDLSPYQTSSYYSNAGMYNGSSKVSYPETIVNPNIKPEKSTSFELGLSSVFLKNRLSFDLTYYNIVDENQIIDLPTSEASGFSSRKVNGNQYTTNGFEVMLNANPVRNNNFRWDVGLNWTTSVKKLTEIYGGAEEYGNYSLNERVDNYYSTGWMKTADGELIVSEETGLPTRDPYPQMFGHLDPNWRFGLQNHFKYKKLSLDVDIDGVVGGVIRSLSVEKMWWGGKHPNSTKYRDEEYAAGHAVYVPDAVNVVSGELTTDTDGNVISDTRQYKTNETAVSWQTWAQNYPYRAKVTEEESKTFANVFDRSYVKLRKVAINYDLTDLIGSNIFKRVEATAYGYNLLMWKKAQIIDPDYGDDDNLQDPSTRYLGLGLTVTF
ncbi:SusC/RagA family TonB-linked outer membrane protein [Maribellus comscasis]|uniref:SusC/RagA family TonB-linked outer membrane protein n=1 Tax=Maribellus comscasis TaxID=2681766 RepID=A0A6I6K0B3_9BACT|nr:SusC/RagA family TonB-linked outer membrane protein [Maribellus comscasis]QGY43334.1 SusC/RagA family TonB-linked outer membrane protein [Maribellus comscasis]